MNSSSGESTTTAATAATASIECLRYRGAGNKLPALLKVVQEDILSEDMRIPVEASGGDSEVPMKYSSKEGKPKSGDVSGNLSLCSAVFVQNLC